MKILLATHEKTPTSLNELVKAGFESRGADVEEVHIDDVSAHRLVPRVISATLRNQAEFFQGRDLVAYLTDELTFADVGGATLEQVATWAQAQATPVIVIAAQVAVSTRELRTRGVAAAYQISTADDVTRVVTTWR
jgi:hypothetical protein